MWWMTDAVLYVSTNNQACRVDVHVVVDPFFQAAQSKFTTELITVGFQLCLQMSRPENDSSSVRHTRYIHMLYFVDHETNLCCHERIVKMHIRHLSDFQALTRSQRQTGQRMPLPRQASMALYARTYVCRRMDGLKTRCTQPHVSRYKNTHKIVQKMKMLATQYSNATKM